MDVNPLIDVYVPAAREPELILAMQQLATQPWRWQPHDPLGRQRDGWLFFHRERIDNNGHSGPAVTACVQMRPGHFQLNVIVPDAAESRGLSHGQYVAIAQEFYDRIAHPAADRVGALSTLGTSKHTLEDHFSARSIQLLEAFCNNRTGLGKHSFDQQRWMAFLLHAFRHDADVHPDVFGKCLRAKDDWYPPEHVNELVHEYDFAMRLLRHAQRH